jgi:hypothetical protein
VIRSDESSFTLLPASGRVYVWRTPKEAYNPECLVPTVKHGGGSVMVWIAISWYSISSTCNISKEVEDVRQEEWYKIPLENRSKLVRIHSKKDCSCIEGKRGPTPY